MGKDEQEESERDPDPADLDEIDVEHIALLREIARRISRIVRLRDGKVGRVSARRVKCAEQRSKHEGGRIYRE